MVLESSRCSEKRGGILQDVHSPGGPQGGGEANRASPQAVREELQRLLASREFRASRRCQDFLRYVVETTLAGAADSLKERTIGMEVFGRPTSYEPNEDATVRVKAGEVRKRLGAYYSSNHSDSVIIDLPMGTYVPEFRPSSTDVRAEVSGHSTEITAHAAKSGRWILLATAVVVLLLAAAGLLSWERKGASTTSPAFDQFWEPLFAEHKPVSLCAVVVPVYSRMREPIAGKPGSSDDFKLVPDQFVAVGDLSSLLQISEMFTRLNKPYRLRIGKDVSFRDIRSSPAVLVGFSYTKWDEISRGFRYFIDLDRQPIAIWDNGKPTDWALSTHPDDPAIREDYAIISRVFDPDTHNILVEISGISHYGTEAASDFVSNPVLMTEAFRNAPPGWQKKNLQVVLHVNIIGGAPSVPTVLVTHFW
jgi:hypothetical protein